MIKFLNKIPAGTFIVPLILGAIFNTINPNLFRIGSLTEGLLSSSGTPFITGILAFISGTGLNLNTLKTVFKNHGLLLISRVIVGAVLGSLYISFFGQDGVIGISALAFITAIVSINPALYLAIVNESGTEEDKAVFGVLSLYTIPLFPVLIYSFGSGGNFQWMSIVATLFPVILGMILGNLDSDIRTLFSPGIAMLLPFLGWNIGQGLNLIEAVQSGIFGILLVIIYYIVNSYQYFLDTSLLKNNGVASLGMMSLAGVSISTPVILGQMYPYLQPYVDSATSQIMTAVIITTIITPMVTRTILNRKEG